MSAKTVKNKFQLLLDVFCFGDPWMRRHQQHSVTYATGTTNMDTKETLAIEILSQFPYQAAIKKLKDKEHSDWSLLHRACYNKWYNMVKLLITKYNFEPGARNESGETPLYCACVSGDLRIVKYLVSEHRCDPEAKDRDGWTPFHQACATGHLSIVEFLVNEYNCDPLRTDREGDTPISTACYWNRYVVVSFLLTTGKLDNLKLQSLTGKSNQMIESLVSYRRNHPFHLAFKVFVVGNQSAGKSTLVKALENRLTNTSLLGSVTARFKKVSGVELRTAGIIPTHVHSPQLGHIIIYDFAGQYEYYSSHAAYLENLASSPGVLFLLVVDISKSTEEIVRTIQYWSSFIANLYNRCINFPEIVLVGSHADVVKSQGEHPSIKLSSAYNKLDSSLASSLKESNFVLNCNQAASSSLSSICSIIATRSQTFHKECEVDLQVHILNGVIKHKFGFATTFSNISEFILFQFPLSRESRIFYLNNLLPSDNATLSQHLITLSEHGQLLYLRNDENIRDSWVILNKELLLSQVNGTIFAPENFKEHHDISSSTGVVPLSEIKKVFPNHDPQMIVGFLTHLEFCHQIGESEASLISRGHLKSSDTQSESYYFFPALVSEERPEESCKSIVQAGHKSGWCLQRIQEDQFFTSRFLHVLLLQLSFRFSLTHNSAETDKSCPVIQRKCNVWKCCIHWLTMDGVEAIVEVVEQSTAVTVVVGCQEGGEMASVQIRSNLIRTVLEMKEKYSGAVEVRESLISPSELESYPLKSPKNLCLFDMNSIALSISKESKFVTRKQGFKQQTICTSHLLYFEPFSFLGTSNLRELFKESNHKKEVDPRFLKKLGDSEAMQDQVSELQETLQVKAKALRDAVRSSPPSVRDDPAHRCYLVLKIWKEQGHHSYGDLSSALSKFSVFCGRNPLVSCRCKSCNGVYLIVYKKVLS